ncbi:hypothetical protein V5799_033714 [Amblyomma americanum]|uniref:Evasin n=1 Tax=Amblyomma americanum TaxID=6943 RepID=A0AAQ4DMJ0_AMBAM
MHSTIAYVFVSALALFAALHGSTSARNHTEDNTTEDYYYDQCTCPAPHLNNTNGTLLKPLGCNYTCYGTSCTAPDNYPCYNLTAAQVKNLTTHPSQLCAVGACMNGTCVKNGTMEQCFKIPQLYE